MGHSADVCDDRFSEIEVSQSTVGAGAGRGVGSGAGAGAGAGIGIVWSIAPSDFIFSQQHASAAKAAPALSKVKAPARTRVFWVRVMVVSVMLGLERYTQWTMKPNVPVMVWSVPAAVQATV